MNNWLPNTVSLGHPSLPRDERIIAVLKDGKEIRIDIHGISVVNFRASLEKILDREITEESRKRIKEALKLSVPE